MDFSLELGVAFALVCAFVTNLAFLFKHRGATAAPPVDIRRPLASAAGLFRSRWFTIGMLVALAAWIFHVLALALAPMSVVRVVLTAGLVLLAVTADRLFGFAVSRRQWAALSATTVGLALIVATKPAIEGASSAFSAVTMGTFQGALLAVGALLIVGPRLIGAGRRHRGLALGAAAGVMFGVSDIALKALTGLLGSHGLAGLVSPWLLMAIIASVTAFYASARSLQVGDAVPVIALTGTVASVVGIASGIVVFGDPMPATTVGIVVQAIGFVLVVVAAALTPAPVRAARVGASAGSAESAPPVAAPMRRARRDAALPAATSPRTGVGREAHGCG